MMMMMLLWRCLCLCLCLAFCPLVCPSSSILSSISVAPIAVSAAGGFGGLAIEAGAGATVRETARARFEALLKFRARLAAGFNDRNDAKIGAVAGAAIQIPTPAAFRSELSPASPSLYATTFSASYSAAIHPTTGNFFLGDYQRVMRVTPAGEVTPIATGLNKVQGLVFDSHGNLFGTTWGSPTGHLRGSVFVINAAGVMSTFTAGFERPCSLTIDEHDNLYVVEATNSTIVKVTSTGAASPFATGLHSPQGIVHERVSGDLLVAGGTQVIYRVSRAGKVTKFVDSAQIPGPWGLTLDQAGNLYVSHSHDNQLDSISKVTSTGQVSLIVSGLDSTQSIVCAPSGDLYVTSSWGIVKVTSTGAVSTQVAAMELEVMAIDPDGKIFLPSWGYNTVYQVTNTSGGERAISPFLTLLDSKIIIGGVFDPSGNLYLGRAGHSSSSGWSSEITKVTRSGTVTTFASGFKYAGGMACDSAGNLFVTDSDNHTLSMIDSAGHAQVLTNQLRFPTAVVIHPTNGHLYVMDGYLNITIAKVTRSGVVTQFAALKGQGSAQQLAYDRAGNLYAPITVQGLIAVINPLSAVRYLQYPFEGPTSVQANHQGDLFVLDSEIGYNVWKLPAQIWSELEDGEMELEDSTSKSSGKTIEHVVNLVVA